MFEWLSRRLSAAVSPTIDSGHPRWRRFRPRPMPLRLLGLEERVTPVISYNAANTTYTQNFNGLPNAGSFTPPNVTTPIDLTDSPISASGMNSGQWFFARTGGDTTRFNVDNGSNSTASVFSYGETGKTDRALGMLASATNISRIGAVFQNNTGTTLTSFTISFTSEQWRRGGSGNTNTMAFEYAVGGTDINTGTFVSAPSLNFRTIDNAATSAALDGNTVRQFITGTVTGISWADGQKLVIRWNDTDDAKIDDGLAIDDFSFTAGTAFVAEPFRLGNAIATLGTAGEYSTGNLVAQNPTIPGYSGSWLSATGNSTVNATGLTYPGIAVSGGRVDVGTGSRVGRVLSTTYNDSSVATFYTRVLMNLPTSEPASYRTFELHGGGFDDTANRRLQLGQNSSDFGSANYGLRLFNSPAFKLDLGPVVPGQTDLFVIKFELSDSFNEDKITVWRNPVGSAIEPEGGQTLSGFNLAFDRTSIANFGSTGTWGFDEVRFGKTWLDVAPPGTLLATLSSGVLTISDIAPSGKNNAITAKVSGTDLVISDANERFAFVPAGGTVSNFGKTLTIPLASVTQVVVNGNQGDDTLTLDWSGGNFTQPFQFFGGDPVTPPGDAFHGINGNFKTITHTHTDASSGFVTFEPTVGPSVSVGYFGLEPVLINVGTVDDYIFNLPNVAVSAFLEDDGTSGNGLTQLRSGNATFELTTFSNPAKSLTINGGSANDTITIAKNVHAGLPDFTAKLTIAAGGGSNTIKVDTPLTTTQDVNLTAETFQLNAGIAVTSGDVKFLTGAAVLQSDVTISTATAGAISFDSTVNATTAGGQSLSLSSAGGTITLSGNIGATTAPSSFSAATFGSSAQVVLSGTTKVHTAGTVTLTSDSLTLTKSITATSGTVTLRPGTAGTQINLGGADGSGTLGLTNSELNTITAGTLVIGSDGSATYPGVTTGTVSVTSAITYSPSTHVKVATARNIAVNANWTSSGGGLTFSANQQATQTAGNFIGVNVASGKTVNSGTGPLTVLGRGGDTTSSNLFGVRVEGTLTTTGGNVSVTGIGGTGTATTHNQNHGVYVLSGTIQSGGAGIVTVTGFGGGTATAGSNHSGVVVDGTGLISSGSGGGAVSVTGTGGSGVNGNHRGVEVLGSATITAGSGGSVTVQGTGGTSANGANHGVFLSVGKITSTSGPVSVTGTGGGTGSSSVNFGVYVFSGMITAGGTAPVTVNGQGGGGSTGTNHGFAQLGGTVTSGGGPIQITGTAGAGPSGLGFAQGGGTVASFASATITLIADRMNLGGTIFGLTNTVTVRPLTAGTKIDLGSTLNTTAGTLELSDAELDTITAGTLVIGKSDAGAITVSAAISRPAATNVELVNNATITVNANFHTGGGTLLFNGKAVNPAASGVDANASTVSFATDLLIAIAGTTVDTLYTQLNVAGTVDLTGVDLVLSGAYVPANGDVFTIVNATAVTGSFTGLADGDTITFNGKTLKAHYTATAVTLKAPAVVPDNVFLDGSNNLVFQDLTDITDDSLTLNFDGTVYTFTNPAQLLFTTIAGATGTGTNTVTVPASAVTGSLVILNGAGGDDTLTVGYTASKVYTLAAVVNGGGGNDSLTTAGTGTSAPNLTINGGTGDDTVSLAADITFAAGANLDVDLQNDDVAPGVDRIAVAGVAMQLSGSGTATLKASRNIVFNSSSISTVSGDIRVEANQQPTPTAGDFIGIELTGSAQIVASGSGKVVLEGRGGDSLSGNQHGVSLAGGSVASGKSTQITGTGGGGNGFNNYGVWVHGSDSTITSGGGDVVVTGQGGSGNSSSYLGVVVSDSGQITSGGTGSVKVTGTGGSGSGSFSHGVVVTSSGQITSGGLGTVTVIGTGGSGNENNGVRVDSGFNTKITSGGGDVEVTGQSGGSGSSGFNFGVIVSDSSQITSGGSGSVKVTGTGGSGNGDFNYGVFVSNSGQITSGGTGTVTVFGTGGSGSGFGNFGVSVNFSGQIRSGGIGAVTVIGIGGSGSGFGNLGVAVSSSDSKITSGGGDVDVTGQGGGSGTSGISYGVSVNDSGQITSGGSGSVIVSGTGGSGSGGDNYGVFVNFSGQITSGGTGTVTVIGTGGSGSGGDNHGVWVSNFNSKITSGGGNVDVKGQGGGSGSGSNYGVFVNDSGQITSGGTGSVIVSGTGGSGSGFGNIGVFVNLSGQIMSGGIGTVTVVGTGGSGSGGDNHGVWVADFNSMITSGGGNVDVTGQGGGSGSSGSNYGVFVNNSGEITSGGSGSVTVFGYGGTDNSSDNYGVWVSDLNSKITSGGGNVDVTGQGGGSGSSGSDYGVFVNNSGEISSGFSGSVKVTGTGGPGSGSNNFGVFVDSFGLITSADGAISVTATGNSGTSPAEALRLENFGGISSGSDAAITITADSVNVLAGSGGINSGTGTTTIRPHTAGTLIDLGGADVLTGSPLTLGLTDAELDQVSAGTLVIGKSDAGAITVSAAITRPASTNVELVNDSTISVNVNFHTGGGTLLFNGKAVNPAASGVDANASTVSFATDLLIAIAGTTVDTLYTQLNVAGTVDLTGVDLVLSGAYVPANGDVFTIVNATAVTGSFTGLADGDTITFNGKTLKAHYTATAVTLKAPAVVPDNVFLDGSNNLVFQDLTDITDDSLTLNFDGTVYTFNNPAQLLFTTIAGATGTGTNTVTVPASAVTGSLVILNGAGGDDTLTVSYTASKVYTLAAVVNGGGGNDSLTTAGTGTSAPNLTINGGTGDDTVSLAADITFAAGANLDVDLQNDDVAPGVDRIEVAGVTMQLSGSGTATLKASRNIVFNTGSQLKTVNGTITLEGNQQPSPTADNFRGILLNSATLSSSGSGGIHIKGRGGEAPSSNDQIGVSLLGTTLIESIDSGTISLTGTGGTGVSRGYGINIGDDTIIRSKVGAVQITGTGAATATGSFAAGIRLGDQALIESTESAPILMNGTGGVGTNSSQGIRISADSGYGIRAKDGDVQLVGRASDTTGSDNVGVYVSTPGAIVTTGTSQVSITGSAGSTDYAGIRFLPGASATLTGATNTLTADSMQIQSAAGAINAGANTVIVRPETAGVAIDLGGADVAGTLGLTAAELSAFAAGTLVVGKSDAGAITVTAPVSPSGVTSLSLVTGASIGNTNLAGADVTVAKLTMTAPAGITLDVNVDELTAATTNAAIAINEENAATVVGTGLQSGTGTVTLGNFDGSSTFTLGVADAIGNAAPVVVGSGTQLNVGFGDETIGSLAGAGTVALGSAKTLTTGGNNGSTAFSGAILGVGGKLVKDGTGTFTMSGVNTYSGQTRVVGGTLKLSGSLSGAGAAEVLLDAHNVVLDGNGTGQISGRGVVVAANKTGTIVQGLAVLTNSPTGTGLTVNGGASVKVLNNTIGGNNVGVRVTGGTAMIQGNVLSNNTGGTPSTAAGLVAEGGAIVDAGVLPTSNAKYGTGFGPNGITGLGISTGGNTFAGYSSGGPQAIRNLNTGTAPFSATGPELSNNYSAAGAQFGRVDLPAENNTWGTAVTKAEVELIIEHDADNPALGFISTGLVDAGGGPNIVGDVLYYGGTVLFDTVKNPSASLNSGGLSAQQGQKSTIRRVRVVYSGPVYLDPSQNFGLNLVKQFGYGGAANGTPIQAVVVSQIYDSVSDTTAVLYGFTGPGTQFGSLEDGIYQLQFNGGVQAGVGGPSLSSTFAATFWRFFGDSSAVTPSNLNGNRQVTNTDLTAFSAAFRSRLAQAHYRAYFDFDDDGDVDAVDQTEFKRNYPLQLTNLGATVMVPATAP